MIRAEKRYGGRSDAHAAAAQEGVYGKQLPACKKNKRKAAAVLKTAAAVFLRTSKSQPPCNSQSILKVSFKQVS